MVGNDDSRGFLAKSPPVHFGGKPQIGVSLGGCGICDDPRCSRNTTPCPLQHYTSQLPSQEVPSHNYAQCHGRTNNRPQADTSHPRTHSCRDPNCRRCHHRPPRLPVPSYTYPQRSTRPKVAVSDNAPKDYLRPDTLWSYQPPSTASKEAVQFWKDLVRLANDRIGNITQYLDEAEAEDFKSFDVPRFRISKTYYPTLGGEDIKNPRECWDYFEEEAIDRAVFTDVDGLEENETMRKKHEAWKIKQKKKDPMLVDMHYVNHRKLQRQVEEKEAKKKEAEKKEAKQEETKETEAEESGSIGAALRKVLSFWPLK